MILAIPATAPNAITPSNRAMVVEEEDTNNQAMVEATHPRDMEDIPSKDIPSKDLEEATVTLLRVMAILSRDTSNSNLREADSVEVRAWLSEREQVSWVV